MLALTSFHYSAAVAACHDLATISQGERERGIEPDNDLNFLQGSTSFSFLHPLALWRPMRLNIDVFLVAGSSRSLSRGTPDSPLTGSFAAPSLIVSQIPCFEEFCAIAYQVPKAESCGILSPNTLSAHRTFRALFRCVDVCSQCIRSGLYGE